MPKILFLQNCQGGHYRSFLTAGSETFARDWTTLKTIQAQAMTAEDGPWLQRQMEKADVIVAHPMQAMPVARVRIAPLRQWAKAAGKPLVMMPALQYDAVMPSSFPSRWGGAPGYPFDATEDVMIAAGFVCGFSPEATAAFFHDTAILGPEMLRKRIDFSVNAFKLREAEAKCAITASQYYLENWQTSRLHFTKGHPLPHVTRHFSGALAAMLGIDDFEPSRTLSLLGPFHFCMPIQRWVKTHMPTTFEDEPDKVCCNEADITLLALIERLFDWYTAQGADEVDRRHQKNAMYAHAKKVASQL